MKEDLEEDIDDTDEDENWTPPDSDEDQKNPPNMNRKNPPNMTRKIYQNNYNQH